jgi:hypothetical protein
LAQFSTAESVLSSVAQVCTRHPLPPDALGQLRMPVSTSDGLDRNIRAVAMIMRMTFEAIRVGAQASPCGEQHCPMPP